MTLESILDQLDLVKLTEFWENPEIQILEGVE